MADPEPASETVTPAPDAAQLQENKQDDQQLPSVKEETGASEEIKKLENLYFSLWPPSQRTRDAVTTRLIATLSTDSVLSRRYGTMPEEEAASLARSIEEEAFSLTSKGGDLQPEDDGMEILQAYSKEISKRMLEAVKSRSPTRSGPTSDRTSDDQSPSMPDLTIGEGEQSVDVES